MINKKRAVKEEEEGQIWREVGDIQQAASATLDLGQAKAITCASAPARTIK